MHKQATRIYLDSRFALPDGSIEIPGGGIECDPTDKVWLSEFSTSASWHTIDESNQILYVIETVIPGYLWNRRAIPLTPGPHDMDSLATEVTRALNGPSKNESVMGTYTCARASGALGGGAGGSTNKSFFISCSAGQFRLPGDDLIRQEYFIQGLTNSTNFLFNFASDGHVEMSFHISGFVDLRRAHNIFMHCPGFGSYNCIGPRGSRNILAKIPVDAAYGQPVHLIFSGSDHDAIEAGVRAVNVLKIELRDALGHKLDLKGGHWSATLIFER